MSSDLSHGDRQIVSRALLAVAQRATGVTPDSDLEDLNALSSELGRRLLVAAGFHGIVPLLWQAISDCSVRGTLVDAVRDEYLAVVARGLRLDDATAAVTRALNANDIPHAYFKGSALAHGYYDRPHLRYGSDVDVLVAPEHVPPADEALKAAGIAAVGSSFRSRAAEGIPECSYLFGEHGQIDLHWQVIHKTSLSDAFTFKPGDVIRRARLICIHDVEVPIFNHADMLLAVAAHACFSGAFRLGWMVDIAVLARHPALKWDQLEERAQRNRMALIIQVMLDRASAVVGDLAPRPISRTPWTLGMAAAGKLWPVERGHEQLFRGAFLYRSTRASTPASLRAAMRELSPVAVSRLRARRRGLQLSGHPRVS